MNSQALLMAIIVSFLNTIAASIMFSFLLFIHEYLALIILSFFVFFFSFFLLWKSSVKQNKIS